MINPWVRAELFVFALLCGGLLMTQPHAAEIDKSAWECRFCTFPSGTDLDVDGGVIWVSDDSAKFGDFTGLDEEGAYLDAQLNLQQWSQNGNQLQIVGRNLGLDSRDIAISWGRQGLFGLDAYYSKIPRSIFDTTRTPFLGVGTESLSLPDNWVTAGTTKGMTALGESLRPLNIEYDREIFGVGAKYQPWQKLELTANYRRDEKDGIRITNGSMLTVTSQFVQPLDYATDQLELAAGYSADAWNVRLGYYGSFFDNGADRLRWETPFNAAPGAEVGQLDLAPDSDFHQVALSGGYRFARHTNLTGRVAFGKGEQDDPFLPYTVNPLLNGGSLPQPNLDGDVDTTNVNLRLRSTPVRRIGLTAEYLKDERDNNTAQAQYDYVITDNIPGQTAINRPYSFDRDTYRLSADYRLLRRTRLAVGWNRDEVDRDFQEREKTETDKLWARATVGVTSIISGWLEVSAEDRDGSEYTPLTQSNSLQNPLMRKYHLADRDRDAVEGQITVQPIDAWDFSLSAVVAEDDYDTTLIGLTESKYKSATLDTSVRAGPVSLYAAYTREEIDSTQNGSQQFDSADWIGHNEDDFDTLVLGFQWPELLGRVDLNVDYTYAKSSGDIDMNVVGLRSSFPQLETELDSLRVYLDFEARENITIRAGYWYEHYSSSDWALDRVFPATVPQLLSLGANAHNYNVNTVLLSLNYAWQ